MFTFFRSGKQSMTLAEVTEILNQLRIPTTLVLTPINFYEERTKFLDSDTYNPQFKYTKVKNKNPEIFKRLSSVHEVSNVDPRISDFYLDLILDKKNASDLLDAVGDNNLFTDRSRKKYGVTTPVQFRNANRILRHKTNKYDLIETETILKDRWVGFDEMKEIMEGFLKEIGINDWEVGTSKRIAKNSIRTLIFNKKIVIDENIKKRATNVRKTIIHEIGTHVLRSLNGFATGYDALGKSGNPGYLDVEEGLATWNEEHAKVLSYGMFRKKVLNLWMGYFGEELSFRDLFNILNAIVPRYDAFDLVYRMKRGLSDTAEPGMYYKDIVYLRGFWRVRKRLEKDTSLYKKLYAGKIGFKQVRWVDDGLIPMPKYVPDFEKYKKILDEAGL